MQDILQILSKLDWSPLYISIKTGIVATFISFFLGIFAARKVLKTSGRVRAVIDGILTLPMVLPPTVAGFFLLLLCYCSVSEGLWGCFSMISLILRLSSPGWAVSWQRQSLPSL